MYRQAAPFSRGTRVAQPRRPGRKSGPAYGPHAHRQTPSYIDATYEARLPQTCPQCQGPVRATVRGSPVVTADETSWRVAADLQGLWAFVTRETTVYAIQPGDPLNTDLPIPNLQLPRRLGVAGLGVGSCKIQ